MHKSSPVILVIIWSFIGSWISNSLAGNQDKWPAVMPLKKIFHFDDGVLTGVKLTLTDSNRRPLYLLECYLNAFDKKDDHFDYTGDLECRLTSLFDDYYPHRTLLTEEKPQLRDWDSRGIFKIEELRCKKVGGVCIEYPGYGKLRHFRLRGMRLSL